MDEPIETYLRFDKRFFGFLAISGQVPRSQKKVQTASESEYRQFLEENRDILNAVLSNNLSPDGVSKEIYQAIQKISSKEMKFTSNLRKPGDGNPLTVSVDDLLKASSVSALTESQKYYLGADIPFHLARLIFPVEYSFDMKDTGLDAILESNTCRCFGIDYIKHVSSLHPKNGKDSMKFRTIIGMEGSGVIMFWTLAPYIHSQLVQYGLTQDQSMHCIFDWVRKAWSKRQELSKDPSYCHGNIEPHFFEFAPRFYNLGLFVNLNNITLGYDERMPSHLMANMLARYISTRMFEQYTKK